MAGKAIALANKETLVVAGELITELALKQNGLAPPAIINTEAEPIIAVGARSHPIAQHSRCGASASIIVSLHR